MSGVPHTEHSGSTAKGEGGLFPPHSDLLQFETLLSDLSARFVSILPELVDQEIEGALERIRDFFQVDRCALLSISRDRERVHLTHAAYGEGIGHVSVVGTILSCVPLSIVTWRFMTTGGACTAVT